MSSKSGRQDGGSSMPEGSRRRESVSSKSGRSEKSRSSEVRRKESVSSHVGRSDLMESVASSSEARRRTESLSSSSSGRQAERISSSSEDSSRRMSLHPGLQSHRDSVTLQQGTVGRRDSGHRDSVSSYSGHRDSISSYSGTIPGHRGSFSLRGVEDLNEGSFSRSRSKSGGSRRRRSRSGLESYSPENSPLYSRTSRSERAGSEVYSGSRRRHQQQGLYPSRSEQLPELYSSAGSNMSGIFRPEPVSSDLFTGRLEQFAEIYSVAGTRSENVSDLYSDDLTLDPRRRTSELAEGEERTQDDM